MSMSTHVEGIKPPDEKWKKMKVVWDACKAAKVSPPDEVEEFFGNGDPDPAGVVLDQDELGEAVQEYNVEGSSGYDVILAKLPKDVSVIRFVNSW